MSKVQDLISGSEPEPETSYAMEVLTSQPSVVGLAGSVAVGAALLVATASAPVAAVPLLAAAAAESLALLFVPSNPSFRQSVDRRKRAERREQRRENLTEELSRKVDQSDSKLQQYFRMRERLESLQRLAKTRGAALSFEQLESLDEATVDYLALWLALLAMEEHYNSTDASKLERRLTDVEVQLEGDVSQADRKHLEKARSDIQSMLRRRESSRNRSLSIETAMMSMADAYEEVYQRIVANPGSSADVTSALDSAVDHLRVEEELDLAVDNELAGLLASRRAAQQ